MKGKKKPRITILVRNNMSRPLAVERVGVINPHRKVNLKDYFTQKEINAISAHLKGAPEGKPNPAEDLLTMKKAKKVRVFHYIPDVSSTADEGVLIPAGTEVTPSPEKGETDSTDDAKPDLMTEDELKEGPDDPDKGKTQGDDKEEDKEEGEICEGGGYCKHGIPLGKTCSICGEVPSHMVPQDKGEIQEVKRDDITEKSVILHEMKAMIKEGKDLTKGNKPILSKLNERLEAKGVAPVSAQHRDALFPIVERKVEKEGDAE